MSENAVFVTGAAGGIGLDICTTLERAGYRVFGGDMTVEEVKDVSSRFTLLPLDVRDPESVQEAVDRASKEGPLFGLVNCAGIVRHQPVGEFDEDAARDVWSVNVAGMARMVQAVAPHLTEPSAVVNIGSVTGTAGRLHGASLYGATKAGVEAYTRYLAVELAPTTRVNAVIPGYIEVPMSPSMKAVSGGEEELIKQVPLGRLGSTQEIADAVEFMLSDKATYVTGAVLVVDGGVLAW